MPYRSSYCYLIYVLPAVSAVDTNRRYAQSARLSPIATRPAPDHKSRLQNIQARASRQQTDNNGPYGPILGRYIGITRYYIGRYL